MELTDEKRKEIEDRFSIECLRGNQVNGIKAVCNGKDVFVGLKTGSGKSMIYESIPVICHDACVIVVAALVSIMKEQTERLCKLGFTCTYIGKDPDDDDVLQEGGFQFIFVSPEALVGEKWRDMVSKLREKIKVIVVDEAHTVVQWGEGNDHHKAFREHFSQIGELRAICPDVPIAALTATSGPAQRRKITRSLCFRTSETVIISESPDRKNIKISSMCVPNNSEIEDVMGWLLNEFEKKKETLPRHIIFSESISDVSKIYAIFRKRIGKSEHYEMFHSKTVEGRKEYIRSDMTKDGKIRILICTNSAGMGVNFYKVHNIIHYGLPREMDTFVQQMGRAGRDGEFAHELIIYKFHKGQLKRVEEELVQLAKDSKCRREILCSSYGCKREKVIPMHMCCDVCEKSCKCELNCTDTHPALLFELQEENTNHMSRDVNSADRVLLKQKLDALQFKLSNFSTLMKSELIHGLSNDVIHYVVQHVEQIFTSEDILKNCAVWSHDVANQISNVINEIFGDDVMYSVLDTEDEDEGNYNE
ncbi:uncharacterized protein LOC130050092 [Ostrea edulis]|uniref:uncharacterized protein LOC130050092 n=1 Tax=Ostrea edulis TaxID=37623 RepID=UPI0024AE8934|nr:uncharacterized protein LOC130050092 [Ostrea edulis]